MKRINYLLTIAYLFAMSCLEAQPQLSAWRIGTDEINFTGPTPIHTGPSTPSSSVYNSISDNAGSLIFHINTFGQIFNATNTLIGTLPNQYTNSEIAIVPNPGNLTNACQKKYYIIYPHLTTGSLVGTMGYAEVDMNGNAGAGSYTLINTNLGNLISSVNPMAISRVNSAGKRYLYFKGSSINSLPICEISATAITPLNISAYTPSLGIISFCNEMELSDLGDKLAFVDGSNLIVVPINPLTGLTAGAATIITNSGNVTGVEFDNTGNKLFFAKPGSGVYVKNLGSTAAPALISGSSAFGVGMLEKSFNGTEIICASTTQVRGIITSPTTPILNPAWTLNYTLPNNTSPGYQMMLMPDQIDGENYALPSTALISSFTAPLSVCFNSPILLNGSASYGSVNGTIVPNSINSYVWTVVECTSTGGAVAGSTEWWSPWGTGTPGAYTLPAATSGGPTIVCGKYYRVKLAVQNACVVWAETTKIIYINCLPSFKLKGSTSKICTGDIALLNASMNAGSTSTYTLNWTPISPAGPAIYNGPMASVTASPTVPTTYLCTVTDNATGCSSTATWYVNILNNDPSFSLFVNTVPATYFTVALTANDPYGYSNSGFYYSLIVEELNGSGTPYYQDYGTDCWWNYPAASETFQGYVSTGTGTFTQSPWGACPAPAGQFLYNHTYRITRGVWNDQCAYRQFSMIISTVKSGNGHTVEVTEDPNAPDYSAVSLANTINQKGLAKTVSIYPNPSIGLYTIELTNNNNASIEIYNVLGKQVKSIQQTDAKTTVDLTGFPKGVYLVNILSNGEQTIEKIILE